MKFSFECTYHIFFVQQFSQADDEISAFYNQYIIQGDIIEVLNDIKSIIRDEKLFGTIDMEDIKAQEKLKKSQDKKIEAVGKKVDKTNREGQNLIQSASVSGEVSTSITEKEMALMNDLWNSLMSAIADRDRKQPEKSTFTDLKGYG